MTGRGPQDGGWFEPAQYPQQQGYQQQQQPYAQEPQQFQEPYQQDPYYPQQGYDPYGGQQQGYPQEPQQYYQQPYDPYGGQQAYPQQPGYPQEQAYPQEAYYQQQYYQPQQPVQPVQQPVQPVAQPAAEPVRPVPPRPRPAARPEPEAAPDEPSERVGGRRAAARGSEQDSYTTGEFTFVDEEAEESEDVIDWLKFAESRSEVRAERRRRLRNRLIGAAVTLAVLAGGAGGYLWWTGKLGGGDATTKAVGGRTVNVVHLRDLQGKVTTALLVNDGAGHKGAVLLLPDTLKLPAAGDTGATTVGQAMDGIGPSATRDGLGTVLGAKVAGTWRLDTPYLELLVAQLGGVKVDTDTAVSVQGKEVAPAGKGITLTGKAAVAYATLQGPGESRDAQMARFGQVLEAVVRTMPTDLDQATDDVHRMNAVSDPSLPEKSLAGVLAQLAQEAKEGHFGTSTLTVKPDGTLDEATAGKQVKEILGGNLGTVQAGGGSVRVSVVNATGNDAVAATANVQIVNTGVDVLPSTAKSAPQATTEIRYTDDARLPAAKSLATSLGLPDTAVKKVTEAQNADLVVVLGKDYQPPKTP
ncbi:LCP family protein [Kitasatospora camelliae]|uniref:LCP family protein n=1 Tax=Kitasatospora camelliae TaxID=3156397 RepID=A0AAU8JUT2_9ACTN